MFCIQNYTVYTAEIPSRKRQKLDGNQAVFVKEAGTFYQPKSNDAVDDMMLFNQVQTWFQNRRTKEKKMATEAEQNEYIRQRREALA